MLVGADEPDELPLVESESDKEELPVKEFAPLTSLYSTVEVEKKE